MTPLVTLGAALLVTTSAAAQAPTERAVAVTFDDLPGNTPRSPDAYTAILGPLIERLVARRVPAIGFVNESKLYDGERLVAARVSLLQSWRDAGLDLGDHGYAHLDANAVPLDAYLADIARGAAVTRRLLAARGDPLRFYRHPFLHTGRTLAVRDSIVAFLAARGMRVAPVTIDNGEYVYARAYERGIICGDTGLGARVAREYLAYMDTVFGFYEAQSRAILGREIPQVLLVHANQLNADHLDALLDVIRRRGYRFVPLARALADSAYRHADTYHGPAGITWLHRWALTDGKRGAIFRGEPEVPETIVRLAEAANQRRECALP